jgi:hypothetical protein
MGQKIMVLSFIRKEKSPLKVVLQVLRKKSLKKEESLLRSIFLCGYIGVPLWMDSWKNSNKRGW